MVPKETCEIHPREVCTDIVKQYPSLKMVTKCQHLPRETCSPERVQPKEVTKPVLKKVKNLNSTMLYSRLLPAISIQIVMLLLREANSKQC